MSIISLKVAPSACIMSVKVICVIYILTLAATTLRYKYCVKLFCFPSGNSIEFTLDCLVLLWNCFLQTAAFPPPYPKNHGYFRVVCGWTHTGNSIESQQRMLQVEAFHLLKSVWGNLLFSRTMKPKHILRPPPSLQEMRIMGKYLIWLPNTFIA